MKKVVFKVRKVMSLFLVMIVLTGLTHQVQAAAPVVTLNSWDLVDSGKHLDWDGRTNYMVMFTAAVNTWNAYKPSVIRKDSWTVIEDVSIEDYIGDNSTILTVSSNGKIMFNQMVMDKHTDAQKTSDCLYALGLALGLGKTYNSSDVMYAFTSSVTTLSVNDKASYDAAYAKY